ncbi:MAG TPA: phosphate ABC transporter permease subunit PstC [Acidimicrobiales bacterium]|nr:phosphate ABC transporter permease subunit PstC [Acidimicrobiales bacterium]
MTATAMSPKVRLGAADELPRTLSRQRSRPDTAFRLLLVCCASVVVLLIFAIIVFLANKGWPVLRTSGLNFFSSSVWQPATGRFGVLGDLLGSVTVALIALLVAFPVSLATALAINEYVPGPARRVLITLVDLLAAVPSLVFGLWGVIVFDSWLIGPSAWLSKHAAFFPLFQPGQGELGRSLFVCGLVVGVMVTPIITSVSREVMSQTPRDLCEGALALGGTKWGMVTDVILPFARNGIIGAALLGLGRALGETMAVTLILSITNVPMSHILYAGGGTIPALIVDWYDQVGPGRGLDALTLAGLSLFVVTLAVNVVARIITSRSARPA